MKMNLVIQERRKALGLTQEQVADHLAVSIPAVSKWETGVTAPDIALLPRLARLLKVDLNTLFCFQEDMTRQEIVQFSQSVAQLFQTEGFPAAFAEAARKTKEYPHNELLLHTLAMQLNGHLTMSQLTDEAKAPYEEQIFQWYQLLAGSSDPSICNSAKFMLASRYIRCGDYPKAQETLDSMPDRDALPSSMMDKRLLQVSIHQHLGHHEKAIQELQQALLAAAQKIQMLLVRLTEAELSGGNISTANLIAETCCRVSMALSLPEYCAYTAELQVAMQEQDSGKFLTLL